VKREADLFPSIKTKSPCLNGRGHVVYDEHIPIYALLIYGKGERVDLTPQQRRAAADFAAAIKATRKRK